MFMKILRWAGLLLVVLFVAAIGFYLAFFPDRSATDSEQYSVISAYIRHELTGESHSLGSPNGTVLILKDSTLNGGEGDGIRSLLFRTDRLRVRMTSRSKIVLGSFFVENWRRRQFTHRFTLSSYALLSLQEITSSAPATYSRFPESYGYLSISNVGFNRQLNQAVFYIEHNCGLCGGGRYVLMRKTAEGWIVEQEYWTWIS